MLRPHDKVVADAEHDGDEERELDDAELARATEVVDGHAPVGQTVLQNEVVAVALDRVFEHVVDGDDLRGKNKNKFKEEPLRGKRVRTYYVKYFTSYKNLILHSRRHTEMR